MHDFAYTALWTVIAVLVLVGGWQYLITNNIRNCPRCGGSGKVGPSTGQRPCKRCGKSGEVMTWFVRIVRNFSSKAREKSEGLRK